MLLRIEMVIQVSLGLFLAGVLPRVFRVCSIPIEQEGLIKSQGHLLCWNIDILVNILVFQWHTNANLKHTI